MPPKDKGRSRIKEEGNGRAMTRKRSRSSSSASSILSQTIHSQNNDVDTNATSVTSETSHCVKKFHSSLTEGKEQSMVDWLEENPMIYNKKIKAYKDMEKKESLWREKAAKMGKDVTDLKTWYTSLRSRFGRLKKKCGQGDVEMTERDEWVYSHFQFLTPHVHEIRGRTTMRPKIAASIACNGATPKEENLTDEDFNAPHIEPSKPTPENSLATGEEQQGSSRMSTPSNMSVQSIWHVKTEEETNLPGMQEMPRNMIAMHEDGYLERQHGVDHERERFVAWMHSVIHVLDLSLWRRCQRELTTVLYRYQAENDAKNELTTGW